MKEYLPRIMDDLLDELISSLSAISLEGAKGVGKTETAKRRAGKIYELGNHKTRGRKTFIVGKRKNGE